jgi:hypothetical protein
VADPLSWGPAGLAEAAGGRCSPCGRLSLTSACKGCWRWGGPRWPGRARVGSHGSPLGWRDRQVLTHRGVVAWRGSVAWDGGGAGAGGAGQGAPRGRLAGR